MKDIYSNYKKLRKNAFRSYWEKRILAEVGFMLELLYEKDPASRPLLEQAVQILMTDYQTNNQIDVKTAKEVEQLLMPLSEKAKSITIVCTGHAHMDMNWMWGYPETVSMVIDTVRTMLTLMKEYPEFKFSQSQASVYYILEKYAPHLLAQVKERIHEGRWEVTASSWVENDKNMPNGESMARHLLYTKKYLSKLLDIKEESMNLDWENDTFGHSYNLPEILNKGGVTRYYFHRAYNGESIFRWRGLSGAEVLVYCEVTYFYNFIDFNFCDGIPAFCEKYGINKVLQVFGLGDHGGGPSRKDIERLMDMKTWPIYPTIKFGTYKEYYDYLEEIKEQLPIVDQEMNYVFTGCYTSESRLKMANRIGEARLTETEILETMAKLTVPGYQRITNLEGAWRKILFNQFHDIIPGSGIVDTREYSMGKFQEAMARAGSNGVYSIDAICENIADGLEEKTKDDTSLGAGVGNGTDYAGSFGFSQTSLSGGPIRYVALFNTTQKTKTEPTEITLWDWREDINYTRVCDMEGKEYPSQIIARGEWSDGYWGHNYCKLLVWMPVPATGYTICRVDTKEPHSIPVNMIIDSRTDHITDETICLENDKVKAVFDAPTMKCISFVRKADGKELITMDKPACGLELITEETSNKMTSWRVGKTAKALDLNKACFVKPKKLMTTGLRKELEYEVTTEGVKATVLIRLDEGSEFLDYRLNIVWTLLGDEKKGVPQLRFNVPCAYEAEKYRYAIPYGIIDRPPLAQDVPSIGLGCAVPQEGESALCMLSDYKYGFRGDKEGLSLNLIRGSYDPDPYPETGDHIIRIAVGACDPTEEELSLLAENYIHPVITRSCASRPRVEDASRSMFKLEGGILSAIKEAEDGNGLIVRVYNPSGEDCRMKFSMPGRKIEAYLSDFVENYLEPMSVNDKELIEYVMGSHEVLSLRVIAK